MIAILEGPATGGDAYEQAVAGEGEFWDNFIARRLLNGEMPGSIDWRLSFTQFRYNHDWRPLALGRDAVNFRMREIRYLLETAAPRPGMRVLDLGCGAGWLSLELARRGAHVTALDISPTNLALARYMAETNARNFPFLYQHFAGLPCRLEDFGSVEYLYADLNTADLPLGEYDAVVVWDSLHHVAELERLFEQVRAGLKPGGIFLGVDHAVPTVRTIEFNALVAGWLDSLYPWITSEDPRWLYQGVTSTARQYDWGPLAVDYDPTPVPGFGEFSRQLFSEMLDIIRSSMPGKSGQGSSMQEQAPGEESPFEDVSASRLMSSLYEAFTPVRFHTICPVIEPDNHIPHYRNEDERLFQHYLACLLVAAGEKAIAQRHTDGQWFVFHMLPQRSTSSRASDIDQQFRITLDAMQATTKLQAHMEQKNQYISALEAELERKNRRLPSLRRNCGKETRTRASARA